MTPGYLVGVSLVPICPVVPGSYKEYQCHISHHPDPEKFGLELEVCTEHCTLRRFKITLGSGIPSDIPESTPYSPPTCQTTSSSPPSSHTTIPHPPDRSPKAPCARTSPVTPRPSFPIGPCASKNGPKANHVRSSFPSPYRVPKGP